MRRLVLLISLLISPSAYPQSGDYMRCAIAGYFQGMQESFYEDLAMAVVSKNDLWKEEACKETYAKGREAAEFYQAHREPKNEEDRLIAQQAALFRAKVRRFIIDGIEM